MRKSEIYALVFICLFFFFKLFRVVLIYFKLNGHTETINFVYRNKGVRSRFVASFIEVFTADLFLNLLCLLLVFVVFIPNIITFFIEIKNNYKYNLDSTISDSIQDKIKQFNFAYESQDLTIMQEVCSNKLFQFQYLVINDWKRKNMFKYIHVAKYRKLRVLNYNKNLESIDVISFERRQDFLMFNKKPLPKQDIEYTWDYIQYKFIKENNDWKLNYYEKDPSDKELFMYFFK